MSDQIPQSTEKAQSCGHPNHGNADHNCKPFLPCGDPACCGPEDEPDYADEWAVDYANPAGRGKWSSGWARARDREDAERLAARLTDGKVMHRRTTPWRQVASDNPTPPGQGGDA